MSKITSYLYQHRESNISVWQAVERERAVKGLNEDTVARLEQQAVDSAHGVSNVVSTTGDGDFYVRAS